MVHSQSLQDGTILLGNVVNTVTQGEIMAIAINTSKTSITLPCMKIEDIVFEEIQEAAVLTATNIGFKQYHMDRINRIREVVNTTRLNTE